MSEPHAGQRTTAGKLPAESYLLVNRGDEYVMAWVPRAPVVLDGVALIDTVIGTVSLPADREVSYHRVETVDPL